MSAIPGLPILEKREFVNSSSGRGSSTPNYATYRRHTDVAFVPLGAPERLRNRQVPCAKAVKLAARDGAGPETEQVLDPSCSFDIKSSVDT
jgi:hypothetical protein